MTAKLLVEWVSIIECGMCLTVLGLMWHRRAFGDFRLLTSVLALRALFGLITIPVLFFRKEIGVSKLVAYNIYLFSYWPMYFAQIVLTVAIVYAVYSLALEPFEPLKRLGTIMFRWVAAISTAVSVSVAIGPHVFGHSFLANLVGQIQQTSNVLTLCLLVFVCFALKPLGLSIRSRAFGVSIGVGVLATTQLVQSNWLSTPTALNVYGMMNFYSGLGFCTALLIWGTYFALPEPERRMVLLPTTSPFFFWNKISEALGDAPGFVAISGFTPESLAPAELAAMASMEQEAVAEHHDSMHVLQPIAVSR